MTTYASFRVEGEYITQLAREKCHYEGKYDYAVELLMGCMETDQLSKREIKQMALEILNGEAELRGTYPNDDYGFFYLDEKDENWDLGKTWERVFKEKKEAERKYKKEYRDLCEKFAFICENIGDFRKRQLNGEYYEETGEYLFKDDVRRYDTGDAIRSSMLDSYIKRQLSNSKDDYGWLEPNGTFYPVEWGEHQDWAEKYIRENKTEEQWLEAGIHMDGQYNSACYNTFGDWLVEHGWVLMHNPGQGIAQITKSETHTLTKAQRDFLYGYYIDRNCYEEANAVMREADDLEL